MNIILTGMRGAGKTTIGKILAQKLNKDFLDLDEVLEEKLGLKISNIVKRYGWDFFRDQETIIVKELNISNAVIATGGGVVLKEENVKALKKNGIFVFLSANADKLYSRIGDDKNRPSLIKGYSIKDELKEVLNRRIDLYKKTADIIIETDKLNTDEVVQKIFNKFKNLFVIIGDPVEHSLSPKMHNAGYKNLGIDDRFNYVKCHVSSLELFDFIKETRKLGIKGICCTIPHKTEVMKYLDKIDEVAQKIGAVNTIVNKNGILKGYNTDWIGILEPLEKQTTLKNKKIAILGAGGAARAAAYAVTSRGAKITIYNRTIEKAEELAKEFGGNALPLEKLEEIKNADIIINATSVGLHENEMSLPKKFMSDQQIIFDLVYFKGGDTELIKQAKEKGAKIISGIEMLLYQGFEQFKLFTGYDAPEDEMRASLRGALATKQSHGDRHALRARDDENI